ncbi:DUF1178 family protein [Roseateles sp.]|jgi:hypothetical protein|uniref:DUF1178 family protein n=1 Tax=Roseateles sp. TaxID=1971397 RepID=UPI0037CB1019
MIVLNLGCTAGHRFEGWFGSSADYETQQQRKLLTCPVCGHDQVQRLPSAPRLNVSHLRDARPETASDTSAVTAPAGTAIERTPAEADPLHQQLQALAARALAQVLAQTEDVGQRFAEEARRIHYGETEARGIRGQTSVKEAHALQEEGIELLALPLIDKRELQ